MKFLQKIPNFAPSYQPGRGLKRRLCIYYKVGTTQSLLNTDCKGNVSLTPHVLSNFGMEQVPASLLTGQLTLDSIRTEKYRSV